MNAQHSDVTLIVRECGERTAAACVGLLQQIFPGQEVHRVSARPFSATLRLSLEKGLIEGRPWTLCIDADVLVLPELAELLREAKVLPAEAFEIQGLVFDKLMTAPRAAGNHLYRTSLIGRALPLIPSGHSLRPETEMIEAMAALGFLCRQSATVLGLHDFEQSYRDLYAKAFLHGHKHRFLLPLYRPLWQMLQRMDNDYRVVLAALDDAQAEVGTPSVSRDFRAEAAEAAAARLGLLEKPALDALPDVKTLRLWMAQASFPGEASALSGQIASALRCGVFFQMPSEKISLEGAAQGAVRPFVALVCANVYPNFNFRVPAVGGGMETRAALFARGLAAAGHWRCCFVVSDFGQPFVTRHEEIDFHIYQPVYRRAGRNVFPRLRKRRWFPVLNLDRRDFELLWQIPLIAIWLALPAIFFPRFWRNLKPDVVCCFGNNALSAEVIADCGRLGIPTMLCIASDKDICPDYHPDNRELNYYGMPKWKGHYSLVNADAIVVQTDIQRSALRQRFGRDAVLIRNPVHVSPDDRQRWLPRDQREYVLWIGHADDFHKRPMLFLDLARSCPQLSFLMVVSRTDENIFLALQTACPENLSILEHVPAAEVWDYLARARLFVNTSRVEGFPNSFLQCAVMGVPVISLEVDPDGILTRYGCGMLAGGDAGAMRQAVVRLWEDATQAEALAVACHRYVLAHHDAGGRGREFEVCLAQVAAAPGSQCLPWWMRVRRFAGRRVERDNFGGACTGEILNMSSSFTDRFEFGANWADFVDKHFSQDRVDISRRHMLDFLSRDSLEGLSVLDIGCGSGLHSLAAWQSGAGRILSFDYDPKSVETARALHRLANAPEAWEVLQGSVLDADFMDTLPQADLVYSWGVLHHTGDVWRAIRQTCCRVAPGGLMYLALYSADMQIDPPAEYWLDVKQRYVSASWARRRWMEAAYLWRFHLNGKPWRLPELILNARRYKKERGMNFMTDVRDWLGGWPMEFCYDADVVKFVTDEGEFKLEKMNTGQANTEFLFSRARSA